LNFAIMPLLSPSLRKAAVLVSALDDDTADAILQQMSADDVAKVRSALIELDDISTEEQEQVLAEFLHRQGGPPAETSANDGVSLDLSLATSASAADLPSDSHPSHPPPCAAPESPFAFLELIDPKTIAMVLNREHPQTAAVVVAHLSPQHAAAVLQELPVDLSTEALERVAWLDQLTSEILNDLASELRQQLAPHIKAATAGPGAIAQLYAVIGAMDFGHRQRALLQLGRRNTSLVNRLGLFPPAGTPSTGAENVVALRYRLESAAHRAPPERLASNARASADAEGTWLTFDDLLLLDDGALRSVFAAADADVALLALTGAEPRLVARILRKLAPQDAATLRRSLEHPGPVRLRDIEQARAALAAIASRLAHEGAIALPPSIRFATAA
jgi:flagellar motor switch protein FliG